MKQDKHRLNGIVMVLTLALLAGRAGATDYTTATTGDWALTNTWGAAGKPSSAADTGLINKGAWDNAVLATTNLGSVGDWPVITVTNNGYVAAKAVSGDIGTTIANPITFDGGKLATGGWNAPGGEWTGPITITANGLISASGRVGSPKLSGKVSGPGGILVTMPDQDWNGNGLTLNNASNDFAGTVVVTQLCLTLGCDHALPTGKVVDVYSAGKIRFNVSQISIASGGTLNVGESRGDGWNLDGPISGEGGLRFYVFDSYGGFGASVIAGTNNTHSGGTLVATFGPTITHTVTARGEGSLGTGPVTVETNTIMALDKTSSADWTLTNTLAGAGTFKVEDGAGTHTLTVLGTVDPGTNGVAVTTNSTGILRVDGDLAFGTGSRLRIHIAGTNGVAGVDYDRLVVDHDLTGLSNAVLEIGGSTNLMKVTLTDQELVVVSNATTLAGEFSAVEWTSPWRGKVKYNDPPGTVKLIEVSSASSPGMVLMVK